MTQKENILAHLRNQARITPIEALEKYGVFRLAAVVNELRNEGWEITTAMITSRDDEGRRKNAYASYVLDIEQRDSK